MARKFAELRADMPDESRRRAEKRTKEMSNEITETERFGRFTLAELQLLQQGLWVIGEQDRVDFQVTGDYMRLRVQLKSTLEQKVSECLSTY